MKRTHWSIFVPFVVFLTSGCGGSKSAEEEGTQVAVDLVGTRVDVAELVSNNSSLGMSLLGEVEASRDAELSTTRGGYVEAVKVREGQRVRKGTVLAQVDTKLHRVLLEQATAQAELAEAEYKRAIGLGDLIPESQIQTVETQLEVAKSGVKQAKLNLERSVVRAPFSGQVGVVHVEQGEVVGPGMPVVRLLEMRKAVIRLNVADRDVVALERGMEAVVRLQAVSKVFTGKVTSLSPVADSDTRSFQVAVSVDNKDGRLLPGMIARVDLAREMPGDSLLIPQDWVVTRLKDQGVFVLEGSTAKWRALELGDVVRDQVMVSTGLASGDRIVVAGHRRLADGDTVLVANEQKCCGESPEAATP